MSPVHRRPLPGLRILPRILLVATSGIIVILIAVLQFYIPFMENKLFEERRRSVSSVIEATYSIVEHFNAQAAANMIDHDQAQTLAIAAIRDLRYGDSGYVWIHDDDLRMVMHPTMPDLDGQDLHEFRYKDNEPMFKEMARVLSDSEAGYVSYLWPKPNRQEPLRKLSYVKHFRPWGWVLGSGVYVDDVKRAMTDLRHASIAAAVVLALFMMLLAGGIGLNITRRLLLVSDGLRKIASSGGNIKLGGRIRITGKDEIGELSVRFNRLLEHVHSLTRFRRTIDTMTESADIYRLLTRMYVDQLGLKQFIIYEQGSLNNEMVMIYRSDSWPDDSYCIEHSITIPIKSDSKGEHEGSVGHQLQAFGSYQSTERHEYFSIWLKTGDEPLGMVCLAVGKDVPAVEREAAYERVFKARQYINEALPVLAARHLNEKLRQSALTDPLTGLHNRRFFEESRVQLCAGTVRHGRIVGLMMCDLDNFKRINDMHGHEAGDEVLVKTARLLTACVRESDMVIRMGGEEFLIALVDTRPGETIDVAEKIRRRVEAQRLELPGGAEIQLTVSIGVAEYPVDNRNIEQAINFADHAAYIAKRNGRNRCRRHAAA